MLKEVFLTFCATSLFFTSVLLYEVYSGKIAMAQPDYIEQAMNKR